MFCAKQEIGLLLLHKYKTVKSIQKNKFKDKICVQCVVSVQCTDNFEFNSTAASLDALCVNYEIFTLFSFSAVK